ncbi:MAG: hypothetical protein H0T68_02635 [Gemmatimonadales bacterium]|nr:hypothetical protein [Gemmatimonadales bacterium]
MLLPMLRHHLLAFMLLAAGAAPGVAAQVAKLYPVDQAVRNPSFYTFRAQLLGALARRDTAALMAVVAPDIKNSFGGNDGAEEFRRGWALDRPGSRVWEELTAVLALGGSFVDDTTFVAPYVFSRFPSGLDGLEHLAVLGSGVRVRARPDSTAAVLAVLSFDVVRRASGPHPAPAGADSTAWEPVQLAGGRVGYVARQYVRSPVGYRAYFSRQGSRWVMLFLVAGD